MVDEPAQHEKLDGIGQRHHDCDGQEYGERQRHALGQPSHGQRRKQHHGALRVVEDSGRLEDQHDAERDEAIEHANQQTADQRLDDGPGPRCR